MRPATAAVAALIAHLAFAISTFPGHAGAFGTRDEAMAMVKRVVEKFKKDGAEPTIQEINTKSKAFIDRDLYAYVLDLNGYNRANATIPAVRGKYLYDMKDHDGKFLIREHVEIAKGPGRGWVDFKWLNPTTKSIDDKSAYIERVGDYIVGVGIYRSEQVNENTVTIISGSPNSDDTSLQMAYDLAAVLNDKDNLRILPMVGIGGPQNIRDVRNLKGIDIGLTQTSILDNFRHSNQLMGVFDDKIVYIARLFTEEVHLVARHEIKSIEELRGKKVNLDEIGSGSNYTMRDFFKRTGIEVEEVFMSQVEAFEKLKSGEIAATVLIAGKPARSMTRVRAADGLHFLSVSFSSALADAYLPTKLTHEDYPDMIPRDESVDTIAVTDVLIAYNWPKNTDRHRRVQNFVEAFFSRIDDFQRPPRHAKWREVNLAAKLPSWNRFDAAEAWLANNMGAREVVSRQPQTVSQSVPPAGGTVRPRPQSQTQPTSDSLFQEFMKWQRMRQGN
jgi:TRAP-type uncharacterized transport system substrate-binding protein